MLSTDSTGDNLSETNCDTSFNVFPSNVTNKSYAPEIAICLGHDWTRPWDLVDRAIKVGADKVQFFCEYINKEMIDKAHANGIICNYFYCDNPDEAQKFRDWGVDTLLTNDYHLVGKEFKK